MRVRIIVCAVAALLAVASQGFADEAEVRKLIQDYVLAFNARELAKVESAWAPDAVFVDHASGERTEGREQIMADIKAAFAAIPNLKLAGSIESVTKIQDDVFNIHGTVSLTSGDDEPIVTDFSAIAARKDSHWFLRTMDEMPQVPSEGDRLDELRWLIGEWEVDAEGVKVKSTVRLAVGGAFLVRTFTATAEDGTERQSTQIIGFDPRARSLVAWTFHSDGSFGTGVIKRKGNEWCVDSEQTLNDGRLATGTYVISSIADDSFTVQLVGHEIDGEPQPAAEPTRMKRVPAAQP